MERERRERLCMSELLSQDPQVVTPGVTTCHIMPPSTHGQGLQVAETSVQQEAVTLTARCVRVVFLLVTAGLLP